jgi:hypothetical protein
LVSVFIAAFRRPPTPFRHALVNQQPRSIADFIPRAGPKGDRAPHPSLVMQRLDGIAPRAAPGRARLVVGARA